MKNKKDKLKSMAVMLIIAVTLVGRHIDNHSGSFSIIRTVVDSESNQSEKYSLHSALAVLVVQTLHNGFEKLTSNPDQH